jgi:hypothetical protein
MTLDPAVAALLAGCLALLFASAALHKLRDLPNFAQVLEAYAILPQGLGERLAWTMPLAELALAAGMLFAPTRAAAGLAAALVLGAYAGAIAVNLKRGRTALACGCGGANEHRPIARWMLWRNLSLAALACLAAVPLTTRALTATDFLTVTAGIATAALLYASLERILGQLLPRTELMRGSP